MNNASQVPPKRRFLPQPHSITSRKTPFFKLLLVWKTKLHMIKIYLNFNKYFQENPNVTSAYEMVCPVTVLMFFSVHKILSQKVVNQTDIHN
jgi:hypothetical protein